MPSIDSNTILYTPFRGTNGSTTFLDDSGQGHILTAHGNAQISTAVTKFHGSSYKGDGTSDFLSIPNSSDWDVFGSTTDNWTIDGFAYILSWTQEAVFMIQADNSGNRWEIQSQNTTGTTKGNMRFFVLGGNGGNQIATSANDLLLTNTWYWITCVKKGLELGIYLDGIQIAYRLITNTSGFSFGAELRMGDNFAGASIQSLNGYMSDWRIQKANDYNASPNILLTDTITVRTSPYKSYGSRKKVRPIIII